MDYFGIIILGVIQGVTEFLPISSSGHLAVVGRLLGLSDDALLVAVVLHTGSLFSILAFYYRDIIRLFAPSGRRLLSRILIAIVPVGIVGLCFEYFNIGEGMFENLFVPGIGLIVTGGILLYGSRSPSGSDGGVPIEEITFRQALLVGIAQCIAVIPGISRSGTTISTALRLKFRREAAASFSFLMLVPILSGAALLKLLSFLHSNGSSSDSVSVSLPVLLTGFAVSAVVGYGALKFLISTLKKGSFAYYAYYCFALGLVIIVWQSVILFR